MTSAGADAGLSPVQWVAGHPLQGTGKGPCGVAVAPDIGTVGFDAVDQVFHSMPMLLSRRCAWLLSAVFIVSPSFVALIRLSFSQLVR